MAQDEDAGRSRSAVSSPGGLPVLPWRRPDANSWDAKGDTRGSTRVVQGHRVRPGATLTTVLHSQSAQGPAP